MGSTLERDVADMERRRYEDRIAVMLRHLRDTIDQMERESIRDVPSTGGLLPCSAHASRLGHILTWGLANAQAYMLGEHASLADAAALRAGDYPVES